MTTVYSFSLIFLVALSVSLLWTARRAARRGRALSQAEARLFETEDLLHKIMDATPNCVFIKDNEGRYVFVNEALAELYDATEDMMLGKTDRELAKIYKISPEEAERCNNEDEEVRLSGDPKSFLENCFTKNDGTKIWFQVNKVPFSSSTVSKGVLGVSLDITQRKLMAEALRNSEEQYRVSIESSPYGILVANREGTILIFNTQLSKATGFLRKDIRDFQSFLDKCCPGEENHQFPTISDLLSLTEKSSHSGEAQLVCRNGERRTFQYVASQRPSDIVMIFFNDVTQQKQIEERLIQAKKDERERISREIHDTIGYTLTSLKMMMEAAIALSGGAPPKLTELLEQARNQVQEALTETRLALHMLRAVQGDRFRGKEDIRRLIAVFEKATGVVVEVDFGTVRWPYSGPIELILYRVIQEGLTNAFKHGRATRVQVYLHEQDSGIRLTVIDNGSGCSKIVEGIGFCGIRERVGNLGGQFMARSKSDGFELSVWVPDTATE